jgi:hypothetical protein
MEADKRGERGPELRPLFALCLPRTMSVAAVPAVPAAVLGACPEPMQAN